MNKPEQFIGWHKSSFSGNGTGCVEVGHTSDKSRVGVRDTTRRWAGHISTSSAEWGRFIADVKVGKYDL